MKRIIIIAVIGLLVGATIGYATIYSYFDDTGQQWFVDREAVIPQRYRDQQKVIRTSEYQEPQSLKNSQKTLNDHYERRKADRSNEKKQVEIFVTDWCGYCNKLESFLMSNKIPYKRYNIEKSSRGYIMYQKLGGRGVPVTKVGGTVIRGFNKNGILAAYKKL